MREYGDTFLLAPFREFYRELTRLKRMVGTGAWVSSAAAETEAGAGDVNVSTGTWVYFPHVVPEPGDDFSAAALTAGPLLPAPRRDEPAAPDDGSPAAAGQQLAPFDHARVSNFVWKRLLSLFERQEAQAASYGGTYGAEFYKEAKYVMVALADEIFLNTEWEGRRYWGSNLLETRLFQTHAAGEIFFRRLDQLLRDGDPVYRDLGAVYLMALSLGFRGKYRGTRDEAARLLGYRRRLFSFVFRREPDLDDETRRLFPETYFHTMREEVPRKLPNPRAWVVLLCATVAAYVAITHGVWLNLTVRLTKVNEQIARMVMDMEKNR